MYLPLILAAIVLSSAIYLLLQYSARTLDIETDKPPLALDEVGARDVAKAA
jgi:hypothetical protein